MNKNAAVPFLILIAMLFAANPVMAQKDRGDEGVKAASRAFYEALGVLDDGTAMSKVWAQRPYVTFIGPRS